MNEIRLKLNIMPFIVNSLLKSLDNTLKLKSNILNNKNELTYIRYLYYYKVNNDKIKFLVKAYSYIYQKPQGK